MGLESLIVKMMDDGLKEFTGKGILEYAKEKGYTFLEKQAKELIELEERVEKKKAIFLRENADLINKTKEISSMGKRGR